MPVSLERRKTVMTRSIRLGHCVCNPRQGCPCDLFKEHNVCPCAGEKLPANRTDVRLTRHVRKAGCASKIGQADLQRILASLPVVLDPNVLLGAAAGDDAGVYRLTDELSLVQTVDVFTPVVDDPYLFGQIAAANSLSDIYAMGARPLTALSIIGFPIDDLDGSVMEAMLRGGLAKLQEAACSLIGGHSLQDEEIKCGFAITGVLAATHAIVRDNAQPGDVLVLTKPLGTGMISFAAQLGRMDPTCLSEAGASMAALNKDAAELMIRYRAHACTDVTGFGLMGHLVEMARNSGVMVELDMAALPVFRAAHACLEHDLLPGGIERNQDYALGWLDCSQVEHPRNLPILFDPQTSGGLLIALPEPAAQQLIAELHERGHTAASLIGRIHRKSKSSAEVRVSITASHLAHLVGSPPLETHMIASSETRLAESASLNLSSPAPAPVACCDGAHPSVANESAAAVLSFAPALDQPQDTDPSSLFATFLKAANRPGLIEARAKKLMAIALSVSQRCRPCLAAHLRAARNLGISDAEIDEAAWLGIAFGGSPAMMLYQEVSRELSQPRT